LALVFSVGHAGAVSGFERGISSSLCVSIDVEDWYDGMVVLGHGVPRPRDVSSGLTGLAELLEKRALNRSCKVTLFVVANYAERVLPELARLTSAGHEIACHGPDHGWLPVGKAFRDWLRTGREQLEELLQVPVKGFRSPRFDIPEGMSLEAYRHELADVGFSYVSDVYRLGAKSPLTELPILRPGRLPVGGGSYQRLLPSSAVVHGLAPLVERGHDATVLYYHSYDFGATLPPAGRSAAVAKQVMGRRRIPGILSKILVRYGSRTCGDAALGPSG
jgi:hypothetical protein